MVYKELPKGRAGRPKMIKPGCPDCESRQTQFRKGDLTHWCRVCGCEFTIDPVSKNPVVTTAGSLTKQEG